MGRGSAQAGDNVGRGSPGRIMTRWMWSRKGEVLTFIFLWVLLGGGKDSLLREEVCLERIMADEGCEENIRASYVPLILP